MKKIFTYKIHLIYVLIILFACFLLVFTNFSYDAEYQMSLAYRILKGDTMIEEMWEPHQTSAFLCAIIMKTYMLITGTTTGIVVFTQAVGLLIRGCISVCIYSVLHKYTDKIPAAIAGIIYLLISPKDLLIPEFSNMQLWFATLMALGLIKYFDTSKYRYLFCSAVCLCLGVLSYPSFVIAYFGGAALLRVYSRKYKKDLLLYTGTCVVFGGLFVLYLLSQVSIDTILTIVPRMLSLEPTHTINIFDKLLSHIVDLLRMFLISGCVLAGGFLVEQIKILIFKIKYKQNAKRVNMNSYILNAWLLMMVCFLVNIIRAENNGFASYPILMIICYGLITARHLLPKEKRVYLCGFWISIMNFLSTLLLSDHPAIHALPYMVLALSFSILPLYRKFQLYTEKIELKRLFLCATHLFLILLIFRCIYLHVPISGREQICSLSSDLALIRSGPAKGLITNEEGAAKQRDSYMEWKKYITPGDTVWLLGDPLDTLGYLYEDVEVGAPSVMSTPTYNENILYYWELNPEKYPDVIILQSGFGELSWELRTNSWLMKWLEQEYQAATVVDGNYWRYYFKEKQ